MSVLFEATVDASSRVDALRRAARQIADALNLEQGPWTRWVTTVSELGRAAADSRASVAFEVVGQRLSVVLTPADEQAAERVRSLVASIESRNGALVCSVSLPHPPAAGDLDALRIRLLSGDPEQAAAELWTQNRALLRTMSSLSELLEDLRESEARWELAAETFGMGAFEIRQGGHISLSSSAAALLGLPAEQTLTVERFGEAFSDPAKVSEGLQALLTGAGELRVELPSRAGRHIALRARRPPEGERIVCAALDVTVLRARENEARRTARFHQELMGIVSHDLKSPLGAVTMGLQLLRTSDLSEDDRDILLRVERAARSMRALVADLLDFTRTRLGDGIPIRPEPTDVDSLLRDVAAQVGMHRGVHIEVAIPSGPLRAAVDAARLGQALTNLFENAIEHGAGAVRASLVNDDDALVLEVWNDGPAVPPEVQASLFEPLRTGSKGRSNLGLGLYIVDQVARAHGGRAEVESREGHGTSLRLRIPRGSAPKLD